MHLWSMSMTKLKEKLSREDKGHSFLTNQNTGLLSLTVAHVNVKILNGKVGSHSSYTQQKNLVYI